MKDTTHFSTYVKPLFRRLLIFASCYYKHPVSMLIVQSFYMLIVNPARLPDIWKCCCRYLVDLGKPFLNGYKFTRHLVFSGFVARTHTKCPGHKGNLSFQTRCRQLSHPLLTHVPDPYTFNCPHVLQPLQKSTAKVLPPTHTSSCHLPPKL